MDAKPPDPTPTRVRTLVCVPVYNHPDTVRAVVLGALAHGAEVLVVDDGSTPPVLGALAGLDVRIVRHETNQGKGAAIRTAARFGLDNGYSHLVTIDADGQHDPDELHLFFAALNADSAAIFVGSRRFVGPHVPLGSKIGRAFSNFWFRVQTGVPLSDTQSGFRAYPLHLFDSLNFEEPRYAFEIEVLVKAAWAGVPVREFPISVHYPPGAERITHFQLADHGRLTILNTKLTLRSMTPWPQRRFVDGDKPSLLSPGESLKRLVKADALPRDLGVGAGLGVTVGTFPLPFVQTALILLACGRFRGNRPAALAAAQLTLPPFVPFLAVEMGHIALKGRFLTEFTWQTLGREAHLRLLEWVLGAVLVGPVLGALVGGIVYGLARTIKRRLESGRRTPTP